MSKRRSSVVVDGGKTNVPAKPPSVNSPADKTGVVVWEKCSMCQKIYPKNFKAHSVLHLLTHNEIANTRQNAL